ncbi:9952_t:CDS:2 [Acaulospora morrowiae]|uniref:Large ribosomal subunit protein mL46 n=1 Tax=Acaulospora morrowiae TaxID=94023 RepID=A0A9N9DCE9_9GLOM|nr:9952_t:CDS:2 [Acaulospora morrowiae]
MYNIVQPAAAVVRIPNELIDDSIISDQIFRTMFLRASLRAINNVTSINRNLHPILNSSRTRIRIISTGVFGDQLETQKLSKDEIKLPKFDRIEVHDGYRIVAGIVLTRSPVILRDPHPFEREYYLYQQRLEQIHAAPFPIDFYFKKGSVAEKRWKEKRERERIETLSSFGIRQIELKQENADEETGDEDVTIASRITPADVNNDHKSLDRALQRTLYLIVKKPRDKHSWQFPQGGVEKPETLLQTATRELKEECGDNMDIWFVGRRPFGYYEYEYPSDFKKDQMKFKGAKVFFMKAHIFAGQVKVDKKEIIDFAWVTKQEMKEYVHAEYYDAVKDMLSEL